MEIGKIKKITRETSSQNVIDVSSKKLFAGLTFTGLISGLVSFCTFWVITVPSKHAEMDNIEKQKLFERLNFVLRNENDTTRNSSMLLFLELGLVEDKNDKLKKLIELNQIPDWSGYDDFKSIEVKTKNQQNAQVIDSAQITKNNRETFIYKE